MDIVKCPRCRARVVLSPDGTCPSCRGRPFSPSDGAPVNRRADESRSNRPRRTSPETTGEAPSESPELLIGQIEELLRQGQLPQRCSACQASAKSVCDVQVTHDDFTLVLPLRVCRRCARKANLARRDSGSWAGWLPLVFYLFILSLALEPVLLPLLILLAAGAVLVLMWLAPRVADSREVPSLEELLSRFTAYRALLTAAPDAELAPRPGTYRAKTTADSLARRFTESTESHVTRAFWGTEAELARSQMPPPVAYALVTIVDRAIVRYFHETAPRCGLLVQVACAVLPGKRNAFEIQGLPQSVADGLLRRLSELPSWPVGYPLVFVIQRRLRGNVAYGQAPVEQPLNTWRRLMPTDVPSLAELALRYHHVDLQDSPVEFSLSDIEILRAQLPDVASLAALHAQWLAASGGYRESLALLDGLIERHPKDIYFRHLRVSCLETADQLERAAAECQAILCGFSGDAATRGYLAHLQWKLGRPEDAIRTVSEAIACDQQSRFYVVRAQAQAAMGQLQLAIDDLNVALSLDASAAEAYLLRSRLYLQTRQFEQALADVDQYHRTAGQSPESVSLKAAALRGKGSAAEAAKMLTDALNEGLEHPALRMQRAECHGESGKLELALEDCNQVIGQFPELASAYALRAALHFESGRNEAALADSERAVELGAEESRVFLVRGLATAAAGDLEGGERDLTHALQLDADDLGALWHRARLRTLLGDPDGAIDDLSAAIGRRPDWCDPLVQRGFLHLSAERPAAAQEDFEAALRLAPHNAEAYHGRARVQMLKGNKTEALADLDKAVMLDPDNVACRLARTNLLLCEDDRLGAKADLDAALQVSPDLVSALYQRAQLHLSLGEHSAARRDFDAILAQFPEATFAYIGRSVAWEQAGNQEQSERDLAEATQAAPEEAHRLEVFRLVLNASAAHESQHFDKAVAYATEALEIDPDSVPAYHFRAAAYWYSERFVEAIDDYSHLIAAIEDAAQRPYNARGQAYAELGEFEKALDDLDRAIATARENGSSAQLAYALNGRGRALTGLRRYAEAERDFAESLKLKPDNAWLHFNRGLLYLASGQPEAAATCLGLALNVTGPPLTPRKRARARGFLAKMTRAQPSGGPQNA